MPDPISCPTCGSAIPAAAPLGQCPLCLFGAGALEAEATVGDPFACAPEVARIAEAFPELEIVGPIGRGGMGAVYLARQPHLGREVALKILPPDAADPEFAERFRREAALLARLNHPNIVTLHDFGERGGFFFLLMEYVEGATLADLIRGGGGIDPAECLRLIPQICAALEYSHEKGVIHRDIKPSNVLIDATGRAKLADFGVAKFAGHDADFALTRTDASVGTPRYMAPEQAVPGGSADPRADVYSLGVVFYEMLTGEVPAGSFDPPSEVRRGVSRALDGVVLRAMQSRPDARYQTAAALREDVESVAAGSRPRHAAAGDSFGKAMLAALAAAALATAAVWYWFYWRDAGEAGSEPERAWSAPELAAGRLAARGEALPGQPSGLVAAVAAGGWEKPYALAIDPRGGIVAWGDGSFGQTDPPQPKVPAIAAAAACGARGRHALALLADGTVLGWGDNSFGGQATPPADLPPAQAIAAGDYHSLALLRDGTVAAWGNTTPAPPGKFTAIAAGARFSLALRPDGQIAAWGDEPGVTAAVPDLRAKAIAAGERHALALLANGSVIAWGDNSDRQCDAPRRLRAAAIFAGENTSAAVAQDGSLLIWGAGADLGGESPGGKVLDAAISDAAIWLVIE
ncbi:MAG: protein kinase [Verrucomicrobiales bacterium]